MKTNNSIMKSKETFLSPIILVLVLLFNIFSCYSKSLTEADLRDAKLGNHDTVKVSEDIIGTNHDSIFSVVDNPPKYPGGIDGLINYLKENLKYPQIAVENKVSGKVLVGFVVDKQGNITKTEILNNIGSKCDSKKCRKACKELEKEALRVVKGMPKWTPGFKDGKPVNVQYTLPVSFRY